MFPAGLRDGAHDFLEARMIELQMDPQGPAQVGVAIRDHVDALDGSDRVDVLQSLERLDRRAEDDVLVRPWRVFGLVAISVALVTRVGSHPGHQIGRASCRERVWMSVVDATLKQRCEIW